MKQPKDEGKAMNDLLPHVHGDEGDGSTHYACPEQMAKFGEEVQCCGCSGHKCKQPAEEYVEKVVNESKEYYKTPQAMIDEQIKLLEGIKISDMSEDEKWRLITAVSEAYHIVLWNYERDHSQRLVNTLVSFVRGAVV